jgi:hypothetical protein
MDTKRGACRLGRAAAVVSLLVLSSCGHGEATVPAAAPSESSTEFDRVVAAVEPAEAGWCPLADGTAYVPLPAPPPGPAAAASYFRYLEGRIYQFGPCTVAPRERNELRVFRYPDAETRDAAIRDVSSRHLRPTASFAIGDTLDAEIWSPDPSLEGPVGRAAAAVHGALGRMEASRHLDVGP